MQRSDSMEGLFLSPKHLSSNPKMNQGKLFSQVRSFSSLTGITLQLSTEILKEELKKTAGEMES